MLHKQQNVLYNIQHSNNPHQAENNVVECDILATLFKDVQFSECCALAGGSTLTMSYNILQRSNNDIDLAITNFRTIDSFTGRFEKQVNKFRSAFRKYLFGPIYEQVTDILSGYGDITVLTDPKYIQNKQTPQAALHILYPSMISSTSGHICLEFSPRKYSPDTIVQQPIVVPYTNTKTIPIPTVRLEQTFWDKIYALHTYSTVQNLYIRPTISRHYYDVACIAKHINLPDTKHMLQNTADYLARHSMRNILRPNDLSDLQLVPSGDLYIAIQQDYNTISSKGILPCGQWDQIMNTLTELENKFRQTQR
ncbi:nucleotidyl transferase AbiEii/AbiGii toxin family protein [bacterium]|nr:nucleotidyl transferase AbiEii/AbiGii toxin family protein [bacterium]